MSKCVKQDMNSQTIIIRLSFYIKHVQDKFIYLVNIIISPTRLKSVSVKLHNEYTLAARALMVCAKRWNDVVGLS